MPCSCQQVNENTEAVQSDPGEGLSAIKRQQNTGVLNQRYSNLHVLVQTGDSYT